MNIKQLFALAAILSITSLHADEAQDLLDAHVKKYQEVEYFSGAQISIYFPGKEIATYSAGRVSHDPASDKVSNTTLFQIGSITKSFTAALMLQLEKEGKLQLQNSLQNYLPQYPKWANIRIDTLLDMTSCLPNYSDTPLFNVDIVKNPEKVLSPDALVAYVYPKNSPAPPLRNGYFYSNTGYMLADMIVAKTSEKSFRDELEERLIKPVGLANTFYPVSDLKPNPRMAHGYQYNNYDNPELVGKDIYTMSLSWAGAAGGIISTTEDVVKWVQALFRGSLLDVSQRQKLLALHSTKTGKAISIVSKEDPEGFGLGVVCKYNPENPVENFWFYEGKTMGFRSLYMYVPANGIIIACAFNSCPDGENDHAHELLLAAYKLALASTTR